jgi:hypothetical protein
VKTFEYKILELRDPGGQPYQGRGSVYTHETLKRLGNEGWELVGVGVYTMTHTLYFKREKD